MWNKQVKIPETTFGTWAEKTITPWPPLREESNLGQLNLTADEVQLIQNEKVVATYPVGAIPFVWREVDCRFLTWPERREWLWYIGYRDLAPVITLLNWSNLNEIDSIRPITTGPHPQYQTVELDFWHYPIVEIPTFDPNVLLVWAYRGDRLEHLQILRATPTGIVDSLGTSMFDTAYGVLDEFPREITFVSANHLLIVDDIGGLTLVDWQRNAIVAEYSIASGLTDDVILEITSWSDDELSYNMLIVDSTVAIVQGVLIVGITDLELEITYAFAAFEPSSLQPLGLIRPPVKSELFQFFGKGKFGFIRDEQLHAWTIQVQA